LLLSKAKTWYINIQEEKAKWHEGDGSKMVQLEQGPSIFSFIYPMW
jgi:hypothetical protein